MFSKASSSFVTKAMRKSPLFGKISHLSPLRHNSLAVPKRNFGIMSEYNDRLNKKLVKNHLVEDKPQYFVTSARPGNFGDHLDFKVQLDNWFDENRYLFV